MAAPSSERAAALSLLSAAAVRERAHEILAVGLRDDLDHFVVAPDRLDAAADLVAAVTVEKYPTLAVPFHARWRHFVLAGRDQWADCARGRGFPDPAAKARAAFDLAIISVLLDAGAGPTWHYRDASTETVLGRSEGLAAASLRMFEAGLFSANPGDPLRADASRLISLRPADLATGFQVDETNPLPGIEARLDLLKRLGATVAANASVFGACDAPRPGGLFDHLAVADRLTAPAILRAVLLHLGSIWPGRLKVGGLCLGDAWQHPAVRRSDQTDRLVPFHKLSQWLTYSLVEPLEEAGIFVDDADGLTGLAEYRNGGLFLDTGVLTLRDPAAVARPHTVDSVLVVEWRALTVALLDRLASLVRTRLCRDADSFPLARVLEGGSWAAGRRLAAERRPDGGSPITVISDATVF